MNCVNNSLCVFKLIVTFFFHDFTVNLNVFVCIVSVGVLSKGLIVLVRVFTGNY